MARRSKSKKELLRTYRDRIAAAKGFRKKEGLDDLWCRLKDLYRGKHFPAGLTDEDKIAVNICFATINVIGPSIAVNYPKIVVNPTGPEHSDAAEIVEAVVNYWWRRYDVLPEFQRAVKDFLIFGFGWLKTGYRFVEEEVPRGADEIEAEFERLRDEADAYAVARPDLAGELPTDEELRASIPATKKIISHDAPFVERVSPEDVYVDPEATSMQDLKWIAQRVIKTHDELVEDPNYNPSAVRKAKPDSRADEETFAPARSLFEPDNKDFYRYTIWEFYDLRTGIMCVFADEGGDEFLIDPTPQPYVFGHPFVMLRNYEVPYSFYPMGELEALEPLQHELNMTRTAMFNDRKQFRRAWLIRESAFDEAGRAAIRSDVDNRVIPVQGTGPLEDAIAPLPTHQPNPQLYQDTEIIQNDAILVSGVNEYMHGVLPEIRRTATEAAIIQDIANARAADKLAKVEVAISEIGRRMVMLAQQYMHEGQVAQIIGDNGLPHHFYFEPSDIQGEFLFEVVGGSTQPKNDMQRRQAAMQLLQTLAPFGDPNLGLINMREVIKYALRDGFGIKDPERFLAGQPDQLPLGMPPEDTLNDEDPADDPAIRAALIEQANGAASPSPAGAPPGGYLAQLATEGEPTPEDVMAESSILPPGIRNQLLGQVGLRLNG